MEAIWKLRTKPTAQGALHHDKDNIIREYERLVNSPQKVCFKYVAEGRANVVFSIWESKGPTASRGRFEGALLRVPKTTPGVTPCDYKTLHEFHENHVQDRVGHHNLVPQALVRISAEVADILHKQRDKKDDSVIRAGYAMLIQDMGEAPGYITLEFKPKWLAQSPIAPPNSKRCRTCAREASRNSQRQAKGQAVMVPICPLGLVHEDPAIVMSTIKRLTPKWTEWDQKRLFDAFEKSGILKRLRELQMMGDPGRALLDDPSDPNLGLAMTLRDCSCYVRVPIDPKKAVEIKLADLDKKNWEEKQTYWQDFHWNLVENGWYTCEENVAMPVVTECVLS